LTKIKSGLVKSASAPAALKASEKRPENKKPAPNTATGFPIVGIGASAGGLAAFEAFFSGMPADSDPGMAFILVQHLAPDHKSILTDLIRRYTRMQVFEVEDGMVVHPNCAYIIPPNHDMAFLNGSLHLLEPAAPRGQRLPIDFFFRSLAQDQHERSICIVLSGSGSDGTLGVRAVKGEGGMVMAQNPASTEYDGMPRSVLATGLVDYELPPAEMPAQLMAYAARAFDKLPVPPAAQSENSLKKIFILLRAQVGHDFSQYKPSTVNRRIERRMAIHRIETIDEYVKYVQRTPAELEALFLDLLIGVTNFFRDPEAFVFVEEKVIPKLFAGKPADGMIRIWTPGCSTGEEAYSLAILLAERLAVIKRTFKVQIFATDIDGRAIDLARTGVYPASIAADISAQRLQRFFSAGSDSGSYRISKAIRDMIVFSEQDVIQDPPFSKLDLISCRNLLIYMGGELQKKIVPLFHYALNPGGFLFLGTSETVGEFNDFFTVIDRKLKVYQRKEDFHGAGRRALGKFLPSPAAGNTTPPLTTGRNIYPNKMPLRELAEQALLQQLASVAALVNSQGDILYLLGKTGMYLEPSPGESGTNNILKMAREGLRQHLMADLHKAAAGGQIVYSPGIRVKTNGDYTMANLSVCPLTTRSLEKPETQLYLVILEKASALLHNTPVRQDADLSAAKAPLKKSVADNGISTAAADSRIAALQRELLAKEKYLQAANEELETSNEELKSSNEEMQSVNEELQSTNEELETSKEELQSVNEELATVNAELQTKVADLTHLNNDMNNLLAGTGIATVFVDLRLCILRFTPTATRIINLIQSDVGRPVAHIVSNLVGYSDLVTDMQSVLDSLVPKNIEVRTKTGVWFALSIQPYRTLDNVIEGAVLTFVDITENKLAREALQKANERLTALQNAAGLSPKTGETEQ
jgi:two-component system, chemotaxis family, CheB/CheR fusion protein